MPRPSWKPTPKSQCQYPSDMEILSVDAEVSSGSNLPPQEASQFVVLKSKAPGVKSITITLTDLEKARKFKNGKQLRVIVLDEEEDSL